MNLQGRTALITGASRGIGRAIALEFARRGADVALVGRDLAALEETGAACASARTGATAELFQADVTDREAIDRIVAEVVARFGRLDCAVANAGQSVDGLLLRLKAETIDSMLDVNLKSAFYLCSAVAKPMMKQRAGSIVLMTSIVGMSGNAGQAAYAASKAGLIGLAKTLALEGARYGVRVNVVAPGFTETNMLKEVADHVKEKILETIPLRRFGKPEEIAWAVAYLLSPVAGGYITGTTLSVNGGRHT